MHKSNHWYVYIPTNIRTRMLSRKLQMAFLFHKLLNLLDLETKIKNVLLKMPKKYIYGHLYIKTFLSKILIPNWYLLVQSQLWKRQSVSVQKSVQQICSKTNNKYTEEVSHIVLLFLFVLFLLTLNK